MAIIKWKTNQEIEDEKLIGELKPTKEDEKQAEFEIKSITLMQELGVI